MQRFILVVLMISAMSFQCEAAVTGLTPESVDLINGQCAAEPADQNATPLPVIPVEIYEGTITCEVTPVPEPATIMLLGMGFLAVLPMQKRK